VLKSDHILFSRLPVFVTISKGNYLSSFCFLFFVLALKNILCHFCSHFEFWLRNLKGRRNVKERIWFACFKLLHKQRRIVFILFQFFCFFTLSEKYNENTTLQQQQQRKIRKNKDHVFLLNKHHH